MPLAWAGLGFALGLFWAQAHPVSTPVALLLLVAVGSAYLLARAIPTLQTGSIALLVAGLLLGVLRGGPDVLTLDADLSRFHDNDVTLTGLVDGTPEVAGTRVRFVLNVKVYSARPRRAPVGFRRRHRLGRPQHPSGG
jgi:hypothetical protein